MRPAAFLAILSTSILAAATAAQTAPPRPLRLDDLDRLKVVRDPQVSPDGAWVAYTVTSVDLGADKDDTDVWMASWDGARKVRLTSSPESETRPRFSPDGRYLSFLSSRGGKSEEGAQVFLLERAGGEAQRVTEVEGGVSDYAWSPDGRKLVLVAEDPDPEVKRAAEAKGDKKPKPKPIVIDRYRFKQDVTGYLGARRQHLYLFDVESRKAEALTSGRFDERLPSFSPDGKWLAFVSKRAGDDPDRSNNSDVFVMEAQAGAPARALTTYLGDDNDRGSSPPVFSPDGKLVAYLQGAEARDNAYGQDQLMVVPVAGGAPRPLTAALDRPVSSPKWTKDGSALTFLVVDDRSQYVARVPAAGGAIEHLSTGKRVISAFGQGKDGRLAVLAATDAEPAEIHVLEGGAFRRLSRHNEWLDEVRLGTTEELTSKSPDGTEVHGLLVKPADLPPGRRAPTLLRIHGGPSGQDDHSFSFEREILAAAGYIVVAANYRGSNGRGQAYQRAIAADWGNKEVVDLLGAVDHVVAQGLADPDRLGLGGWSYGGILTNYTIARDHRFKAATSGAGSSNQLTMYGVDHYIVQYETELGPPWKSRDLWLKVSYPFFEADKITTPTLFLGGEKDFNVPLVGGEQMYQALRSLGI
ncbi:MAG TPA: S9 family peptidase, partial [Vicinamibacteria bacterium]|nr:S9 family peptidase [Vicinamibacteria bacterium]